MLTPAVLTLLGRVASWPSRRIRTEAVSADELHRTAVAGSRNAGDGRAEDADTQPNEKQPNEKQPDTTRPDKAGAGTQ